MRCHKGQPLVELGYKRSELVKGMLETGILHGMHLLAIRGDQGIAVERDVAEVRYRTRSLLMKS